MARRSNYLPRLILIANRFTDEQVARCVEEAVVAGVRWVHLRDHEADEATFAQAAEQLVPCLASAGARISVNARLGIARALGTDLHVGTRGPGLPDARERLGSDAIIGYSAHDVADLSEPDHEAADYFFLSPIFPTGSKPEHPGLGVDVLRRAVTTTFRPVYALGGITPDRIAACLQAGAHGVAVVSGILHADDHVAAVQRYLAALDPFTLDAG